MKEIVRTRRRSYAGSAHPLYGFVRPKEWGNKQSETMKRKYASGEIKITPYCKSAKEREYTPLLKSFGYQTNKVIGRYQPDFVNEEQKHIIEFYGLYWHGHTSKFKNDTDIISQLHMTVREKRDKDDKRIAELRSLGYKTTILWENEINEASVKAATKEHYALR